MKLVALANFISTILLAASVQADIQRYLESVPECGVSATPSKINVHCFSLRGRQLSCVTSAVPQFNCNASEPCICDNKPLLTALTDCVSQYCSVIDQLRMYSSMNAYHTLTPYAETVNLTIHQACGHPIQSRQAHLIGTVGLGLVAFALVNLRLYSRWKLGGIWNADDWIMVGVDVRAPSSTFIMSSNFCPDELTTIYDRRLSRSWHGIRIKHLRC